MNTNLSRFFLPLTILGFLLSILIAGLTYHPDLRAFALASRFIHSGEVTSFYDHISRLPASDPFKKIYGDDIFIYPPLAYLYPASVHYVTSPITDSLITDMITQDEKIYANTFFDYRLIFLKLPSLIAMVLIYLFLPRLFTSKSLAQAVQLIFLFLPANLLVSAGMGQADTALTLFLLLSLIAIRSGNFTLTAVFLALSALFKPASLVLLPILFVYLWVNHGLKKAVTALLPGILVWTLIIAPYITSPAFRMYAFLASLSGKTSFAGIAIAAGTIIPWFYIVYTLVIFLLYTKKLSLIDSLFVVLFSTLAFNHFHPQWFLWLTPFLLFLAHREQNWFLYLVVPSLSWLAIWLAFEPSLHLGMFLATKITFPPTIASPLEIPLLVSLARSSLVALLVYHLWSSKIK